MSFCAPPRAKSWRRPQCSLASLARVPKVTPLKNPRSANGPVRQSMHRPTIYLVGQITSPVPLASPCRYEALGARASPRLPAIYFYASLCSYKSMNAISHVTCAQDFAYTVIKFSLFFILLLWRGRSIHAAYCPTHRLCLAFLVFWRKMSRIYTLLLHTSNRMYHIAYQLLPSPVTLNVVRLLQDLSNAIRRTFVRHFARFN